MEHIVLHVFYHCKPGMAVPFVNALKESGAQSAVRGETGCMQYDYHLSCEEKDTVVLLEKWDNAEVLKTHMAQPHMQTIRELKERYVEKTELERYE